jgi:ATP/ADP translocase
MPLTALPKNDKRIIWLFFWHNFLLGIGTILVYVSANVILLENHPETSLPIAYILSAITLFVVGKIYEYFEHHLQLEKLATTVLIAILILVLLTLITLTVSHTVAIAVGIMVSYRVIYLLGNLEFWGISALAFDVRQSKRLFSSIGSGDMPAKAMGAILAALIHSSSVLLILLGISLVAFFLAFLIQRLTFKEIELPDPHHAKTRKNKITASKLVQGLFGGNVLVFQLCLCVLAIAAAATWIEYHFFVNVKYKFHSQHDVLSFIGYLLMVTYLIATVIKFLFSGRAIEKYGVKYAVYLLPATTALISFGLVVSSYFFQDETSLLVDYCVAYICFEVARRTVFDPVFLVLFQPLSIQTRLKGHTLAKGFYEPLGMGIAGAILWGISQVGGLAVWGAFVFTMACALAALFFVTHAYKQYVIELKSAISKRFIIEDDLVFLGEAKKIIQKKIESTEEIEVLYAIEWLAQHQPEKLKTYTAHLLKNPSKKVRIQILQIHIRLKWTDKHSQINEFITTETDFDCKSLAAEIIYSSHHSAKNANTRILTPSDLATTKGYIKGRLKQNKDDVLANQRLLELVNADKEASILAALEIMIDCSQQKQDDFIKKCLKSTNIEIKSKAIEVVSAIGSDALLQELALVVDDKKSNKKILLALVQSGDRGVKLLQTSSEGLRLNSLQNTIRFMGKYPCKLGNEWLLELAESPYFLHRKLAFKSLLNNSDLKDYKVFFEGLIQSEMSHIQRLHLVTVPQQISVASFDYEFKEAMKRLFYLCMLLYDKKTVQDAALGLDNSAKEKRANALETLEHILPRSLYLCINSLVSDDGFDKKHTVLKHYTGNVASKTDFLHDVLSFGEERFGNWTVVDALRNWQPKKTDFTLLLPYLTHSNKLLQEAGWLALEQSQFKTELLAHIDEHIIEMKHKTQSQVSHIERVIVLKNTPLFAQTPENVLSSIVPIMNEIQYKSGQEIFKKGDIGNCMYVVYSGEVGIYDGDNQLVTFRKGDIFGELALLDAEPRSAGATAETDSMIFRIDQEDFADLMSERDEILRSILTILCQRIRTQNTKIREGQQVAH